MDKSKPKISTTCFIIDFDFVYMKLKELMKLLYQFRIFIEKEETPKSYKLPTCRTILPGIDISSIYKNHKNKIKCNGNVKELSKKCIVTLTSYKIK